MHTHQPHSRRGDPVIVVVDRPTVHNARQERGFIPRILPRHKQVPLLLSLLVHTPRQVKLRPNVIERAHQTANTTNIAVDDSEAWGGMAGRVTHGIQRDTYSTIISGVWDGDTVMRRRSLPRGTVG